MSFAEFQRREDELTQALSVVIDANTASQHSLDLCRQSIAAFSRTNVSVTTATGHTAQRVLEMADGDVVIITAPTHRWDPETQSTIEAAFANDPTLDLLVGPELDGPANWSPDRLRTRDYLGGVIAMRAPLARALRGIRTELYPHHRWDLALRASEIAHNATCTPRPLARRVDAGPLLSNPECVRRGRQVLNEHLVRAGISGLAEATPTDGEFRVRPVLSVTPSVSIIVPSPADQHLTLPAQLARLEHLISALRRQAEAAPVAIEIVVVTQSSMPQPQVAHLEHLGGETTTIMAACRDGAMKWRYLEAAAARASGDIVVVIEDDAIPEADDWLQTMAALALDPTIGAVSAVFNDHAHARRAPADPLFSMTGTVLPGCVAMRRELFIRCTGILDDSSGTTLPRLLEGRGLICVIAHYASFRRWTERARTHTPRRPSTRPRSSDRRDTNHGEYFSRTLRD